MNERSGTCIVSALIGPSLMFFAVFQDNGKYVYWIDDEQVPADVYLSCLSTADKDRYCPECMGEDHEGCDDHDPCFNQAPRPEGEPS